MNFIQVPHYDVGRKGHKVKAVVLHIGEGSSESIINWFLNPLSKVSSHYLITEKGQRIQFVKEEDTAWHAGLVVRPRWAGLTPENPNLYTIGIETALRGPFELPTWKTWIETARLVKELCERYDIPKNEMGIVNHNEINGSKSCPGWWMNRFYILTLMRFI